MTWQQTYVGWCAQCGPLERVDEEGCCPACGATATGPDAEVALAMVQETLDAGLEIPKLEEPAPKKPSALPLTTPGTLSRNRP